LYGKQSGAEVSYNPHKPGRPSHALHTYWVGNLRLVLDVVVSPGKEHSAAKARPGLIGVLEKLTPQQRPALVRGDCGFGNEPFIAELENRAQPYLFKLRQTVGVKKLLARQFARDDWSTPGPSDQGWSAVEDTLKLSGWDKSRRVVILRRAVKADLALSRKTKNEPGEQIELLMPDKDVQAWEYAVLVTNSTYALDAFGQLYRDRADCENGFDELKNQWGWAASRPRTLSAARPVPAPWRSCTTGGHGIAERPNRAHAWRPSRVAHYCSPVWGERSNMLDRPRCISRPCTPQKTSCSRSSPISVRP